MKKNNESVAVNGMANYYVVALVALVLFAVALVSCENEIENKTTNGTPDGKREATEDEMIKYRDAWEQLKTYLLNSENLKAEFPAKPKYSFDVPRYIRQKLLKQMPLYIRFNLNIRHAHLSTVKFGNSRPPIPVFSA